MGRPPITVGPERRAFRRQLEAALDWLEANGGGGGGGGATNLSYTAATRLLASSTGSDVTLPLVGGDAGLMSAADKAKLDGIAPGATANAADAALRDRTTHTGAQSIATITGLQAALDGKQAAGSYAAAVHGHVIGDVTGLQAALDGKADFGHTHPASQIADSTAAGRAMLTAADAAAQTALLNLFTAALRGLVPPSGGGTANFLRADGTWAAPPGGGGGGPWTLVEQAADAIVNNSTAFQNSGLTFPVAANTTYRFRGQAFIQTGATADAKFQFTGPAFPTLLNIRTMSIAQGATAFSNIRVETAYNAVRAVTATVAGVVSVEFEGILQNGVNSGAVMFQWGQNTLEAVNTILRRGSYIEWATG